MIERVDISAADLMFVRHGEDHFIDGRGEALTDLGETQALDAAVQLESEGFNEDSLILASTAPRAEATGRIIADLLGSQLRTELIIESRGLSISENISRGDPRTLIRQIIEFRRLPVGQTIAVVTHQPFIDLFNPNAPTRNGEVVRYVDGNWRLGQKQ